MPLFPPTLDAPPLRLVRWDPADARAVHEAVTQSFAALHEWMSWASERPSRRSLTRTLRDGHGEFDRDEQWQYTMKGDDGDVVGVSGLRRISEPAALEIGYWVRTDRTGLGYATAAARSLTTAAFTHTTFCERVEIHMDQANLASARVPDKLGYTRAREEDRPLLAPSHTGRGYVWTMERVNWPLG